MHVVDAVHEWHEFFFLIGTAGATLLALLFVAVSLGVGFLTNDKKAPTRMFMSPVVIHFSSVFFVSAVTLAPLHNAAFFAALIGATAVIGAMISSYTTVQILRTDMTNYWEDYLAYGMLPAAGYFALLTASVMVYRDVEWSLDVLAGSLLLLTLVNIRNAWDLTLTMVRRPQLSAPKPEP
jgi:hypothetical protein